MRYGKPLCTRHYRTHPRGCPDSWTDLLARHTSLGRIPRAILQASLPQSARSIAIQRLALSSLAPAG